MGIGTFALDFADWLDYTVTYYPWTGYDKYGAPTYGTSSTIYCYRVDTSKLVKNAQGQEVVSSHQLYIAGSVNYDPLDKFVPNGATYSPTITVEHFYNDKAVLELSVVYI
jgi:hypothetical protein